MPVWMDKFMPIAILLMVVGIVLARLPKVEGVEHAQSSVGVGCSTGFRWA